MMKHKYCFIDFASLDALMQERTLTRQLIHKYQQIFNDPALWGEQYTFTEVMNNLHKQLSGDAAIRLCLNREQGHQPVAFCWAQVLTYKEIVGNIENVQFYQSLGAPQVAKVIQHSIGDGKAIYLHDLGVSSECRGEISLKQLIQPTIVQLARRSGVEQVFYWSIHDTRVHRLAARAGHELVAEVAGMQFFSGSLHKLLASRYHRDSRAHLYTGKTVFQSCVYPQGMLHG